VPETPSCLHRHRALSGTLLALLSGLLFTGNNFVVNQFSVAPIDLVLVRSALQLAVYTAVCCCRREHLLPGSARQQTSIILQGLAAGLMLVCATTSFTLMPVPDALCIIFACPVVTILLSAAVLGDSLNPPKLAAALLLFSGVALVCRPPFIFGARAQPAPGSGYYLGAALAVTACVAQGVACVLVARCREVATPVLAAWSSVAGLVLGAASCLLDQSTPLVSTQPLQWATLLGLSVCGLVAFTTLTLALQLISPNLVSSLRCLEMVAAFLVQSLITGATPSLLSSAGGLLVILGITVLALQHRILHSCGLALDRLKRLRRRGAAAGGSEAEVARLLSKSGEEPRGSFTAALQQSLSRDTDSSYICY